MSGVTSAFQKRLEDTILDYYVKCYIEDSASSPVWTDFSDDAEINGVKRFKYCGKITHGAESNFNQFYVRPTTIVMDNYDHFWDAPFPSMKDVYGTTATWTQTDGGQQTVLKDHKLKLEMHLVLIDGTIEKKTIGTFIIEDYETDLTSGECRMRVNSLAKRLMMTDAERVKDGTDWYRWRSVRELVEQLLLYSDKDSHDGIPGGYFIPDAVSIDTADGNQAFSTMGRPPDLLDDGSHIRSDMICRTITSRSTVTPQRVMYLGVDEFLYRFNPQTGVYTLAGTSDLGTDCHIRKLVFISDDVLVGVAWTDQTTADTGNSNDDTTVKTTVSMKIFHYTISTDTFATRQTVTGVFTGRWCVREGNDRGDNIEVGQVHNQTAGENVSIPFRQAVWNSHNMTPTTAYALMPEATDEATISADIHSGGVVASKGIAMSDGAKIELEPGYHGFQFNKVGITGPANVMWTYNQQGGIDIAANGDIFYMKYDGTYYDGYFYDYSGDTKDNALASFTNQQFDSKSPQPTACQIYKTGNYYRVFLATVAWYESGGPDYSKAQIHQIVLDEANDAITTATGAAVDTGVNNKLINVTAGHGARFSKDSVIYIEEGANNQILTVASVAANTITVVEVITDDYTAGTIDCYTRCEYHFADQAGTEQYAVVLELDWNAFATNKLWAVLFLKDKLMTKDGYRLVTFTDTSTTTPTSSIASLATSSHQFVGMFVAPFDETMHWFENGTGKIWNSISGVQSAVSEGDPATEDDLWLTTDRLHLTLSVPTDDPVWGATAPYLLDETQTSGGVASRGNYFLFKYDEKLTPHVPIADFTDMSVWDALVNLAEISNHVVGYDEEGNFFFLPRPTTGIADYILKNDAEYDRVYQIKKSSGLDQIFNYASIAPYKAILTPPELGFVIQNDERQEVTPVVVQKDVFMKTIELIAVRGGVITGQWDQTTSLSMDTEVRFKWRLSRSPIAAVVTIAAANNATSIYVHNTFGGDDVATGIRVGDYVAFYDTNRKPIKRRITGVSTTYSAANGGYLIQIESTLGIALTKGDVLDIVKLNTYGSSGSGSWAEWSDEGITYLDTAMGDATAFDNVDVETVREIANGTVIRLDEEELRIVDIDDSVDPPEIRLQRKHAADERLGISLTTPATHADETILKAYFVPISSGDGENRARQIGRSKVFLGFEETKVATLTSLINNATTTELTLDRTDGIQVWDILRMSDELMIVNEIDVSGGITGERITVRRGYGYSTPEDDVAIGSPIYRVTRFEAGDRITIKCLGERLERDEATRITAIDAASTANYGRKEYSFRRNPFVSRPTARDMTKRIINLYRDPHYTVTVDAIMLPYIGFVQKDGWRGLVNNGAGYPIATTAFTVDGGSPSTPNLHISEGDQLRLGPSTDASYTGQTESLDVASSTSTIVTTSVGSTIALADDDPVNLTPRIYRLAVQNEHLFPRSNFTYKTGSFLPYAVIGYPVQVVHDPMNCKTTLKVRAYTPY